MLPERGMSFFISMKKLFIFLFALNSFAFVQAQSIKGKLIIIGGGSRPDALVERIIEESKLRSGGYCVILPMSSEDPDSSVYYASQQFLERGIKKLFGFNFKKGEPIKSSWIDSIRTASLIYITGGDQTRFMGIAEGTEIVTAIHDAYRNGAVVSGTSAGAAVMSKLMITGNELKKKEYSATFETIESNNIEIKTGLGLLTTTIIDQHFLIRSRHNRLLTAIIEHPEMTGIGIDESTAILVSGKNVEVLGASQVLVYKNPSKSKMLKNEKLAARKLTVDIYLPGEKFKLP
ncbi:MAG TPA: cyanophycinase [Cyclobacteriaceae bacterium]|nr:cyanophycinase [Cyclobacteriaceae bacterium]HMY94455.1 cyanophycinase [Cyclobacteriaceae bacterium]HNC10209.1 cyanophycinase [Cyclobacteriaceae bacterium]HNL44117.1 cyanophycinase [Cyclobacteriaceae bacterium]HNN22706.1 cyanophycinase [Cyclobacteriaceae bacterium]